MIHYKEFKGYKPQYYRTKGNQKTKYKKKFEISDIFTFDIETTSFFLINNKLTAWDENIPNEEYLKNPSGAVCYIWQFSINNTVYYGRELKEFPVFLEQVFSSIDYATTNKPIIYVHNLSWEFQFIREYFNFTSVFARTIRKPMKAETKLCEFRCTYMLTNLRLEKWAEQTPVQKKVGQLDYNVLRTPLTDLNEKELEYCEYDCLVVYYGICNFVKKYGTQHKIPLTQTGESRVVLRKLYHDDWKFLQRMANLVPDAELFRLMRFIFAGGSTGSNVEHTDEEIYISIDSEDEKSAYPAHLVKQKYPLTPFVRTVVIKRFEDMDIKNKAYLMVVRFKNIRRKTSISYISKSKLIGIRNSSFDNGKLIRADECIYSCTSVDIDTVNMVYDYDDYEILTCYASYLSYLDSKFIDFVLTMFYNKTCLDGVDPELYMQSKQFLNALYGINATSPISDEILYDNNEWGIKSLNNTEINDKLKTMRKSKKNITAYQIGIFVTAYNRRCLYDAIMKVQALKGEDGKGLVVYYDTDSCKHIRDKRVDAIFEQLNEENKRMMDEAMRIHGFDIERTRPKNPKGKVCQLGCWERDDSYQEFKTLGAKRYCYKKEGKDSYGITIAGVPKSNGCLIHSLSDFNIHSKFPANARNKEGKLISKNIHQYRDGDNLQVKFPDGYINDNINATVLRPTSYDMTLANEYKVLIQFIKNGGL